MLSANGGVLDLHGIKHIVYAVNDLNEARDPECARILAGDIDRYIAFRREDEAILKVKTLTEYRNVKKEFGKSLELSSPVALHVKRT